MYSIDDPEATKIIYNTTNVFPKSSWYSAHAPPHTTNIFTTPDNKDGARMRRNFAPAFTMSALLAYEPSTDGCGDLLIQKLKGFAELGETIDLGHWMLCYAFDVQGGITVRSYVPK